ncbi:PREDICTED: MLO-like protein 1 [Ipomoea nil]|uniref:MLO-like protein 1 n=1 Tax=Ipomoea nil TaxID=35883 RepID=UPI00090178A0|nr:PREDICTED: MLO-like protein 1 [Ipomoea nil]
MSGGGGEEETTLEFTPTWVVAAVCTVIVAISLAVERLLHFTGKYLKKKNQKPLYEALQKIKEELMLLGFISLLLTVSQSRITKICVPEDIMRHLLPCSLSDKAVHAAPETNSHHRRLLSGGDSVGYCAKKHKVPLLSLEGLHHLHIFIFVLAIVHVTFSLLTIVFGGAKIRQWKHWEDAIAKHNYENENVGKPAVTNVQQHDFIKNRFVGLGKRSIILGWLHSFFKQFYGSVTKSDYTALRLGFIMTHCRGNPKFNFHKYMIRALEDDFKTVVGISWYLWVFVVIFLLLNINGWHTYFWIAFIPFILLLAVGTKLEHVIIQLAHEVAEKHVAIEGELVVQPSDEHFWFGRPQIVLFLIHFILFQNAFEIAFFFWILVQYGFDSCIMGHVKFIIPRLVIGVIIQVLCSYSTLPIYAIVTQMGTHFKKSIFDEHIQVGLVGWAQKAKQRKGLKAAFGGINHGGALTDGSSTGVQMGGVGRKESGSTDGASVRALQQMGGDGSK